MNGTFSSHTRNTYTKALQSEELDLLIIGGGITGAGILLDANLRGMNAAVVEMQDFAAGTSSRSTKLVHGGLRYLKQFEVGLVAEVGKERAIVYENAPHVTTPVWMLLPIVQGGTYGRLASSVGIYVYDILAGVKRSERRKMLSAKEALFKEPLLRTDGLLGGGYYVEYRTDDARLTLEILKEAVAQGAKAVNYTRVESLNYANGRVTGAHVRDLISNDVYDIRARKVVNAAGPWVDNLRELDRSKQGKTMHLTKGVHIVVDQNRFPLHNSVYFDVPDGRMIFAIPREGKTYIGTTDTNYVGDLSHPRATVDDVGYLVQAVNYMFPSVHLTEGDVESMWAGVRPLIHEDGKSPSEISRRDEVFHSPSGLFTIAGGKLTGYRKMADKVVTMVANELKVETGRSFLSCQTAHTKLSGGKFSSSANMPAYLEAKASEAQELGLNQIEAEALVRRYGSNSDAVLRILIERKGARESSGLSAEVFASLVYGIEEECVITPDDFFTRRTGRMFFDIEWVRRWKEPVIQYMATVFEWDEETIRHYSEALNERILEASTPVTTSK